MTLLRLLVAIFALSQPIAAEQTPLNILVMGDSALASHQNRGLSVGDVLAVELGAKVKNRPVLGAAITYPLPITGALGLDIDRQYRDGDWDWVVLNGGGNDLWLGCACHRCSDMMNRLISEDGRAGAIPQLAVRLYHRGARVAWVGYLRSPGLGSIIEGCADEGAELEKRIRRMTALVPGIEFIPMDDIVPFGDDSFLSPDRIHPSPKGSAAMAKRIADFIRTAPPVYRQKTTSKRFN